MIPVNTPRLNGNEARYLQECIDTGWISSEGSFVRRLEEGLAAYTGRKHAIAVCNGSAALDAALIALNLGPGDEVILPTLTIISCAAAIVHAGAVPVPVDCDPVTFNMTPEQVEAAITPQTKAIMAVHIYGLPVDMGPILTLAEKHGLYVIEDAAEAIGQECRVETGSGGLKAGGGGLETGDRGLGTGDGRLGTGDGRLETGGGGLGTGGRKCGSMGDISTFSFYPNKHITSGEGGMVLTDDDELADRCRNARNLFFGKQRRFVHEELGYNLRMSNLQAAVGLAQFEQLEGALVRKKQIGALYHELLADVPGIQLPVAETSYAENVYWIYSVVLLPDHPLCAGEALDFPLENREEPFPAEVLMNRLAARKIGSRPFFWPMHRQPVFLQKGLFEGVDCPVAERLAKTGLYIPSGLALSDDEIRKVCETVRHLLTA